MTMYASEIPAATIGGIPGVLNIAELPEGVIDSKALKGKKWAASAAIPPI